MKRLPWTASDLYATIAVAAAVGVVAAFAATGMSFRNATDATIHPATMAVLLCVACIPLIRWAVRGDQMLFRIVLGGLLAKGLGMYLRFVLTGNGDNKAYHQAGTKVAGWLSDGFVLPRNLPEHFGDTGTDWLSYMVGWLYYFTGPNRLTAYVVFTFLSFVGTLFFFRAAISEIPELDKRRYAWLLFYLPSLLFWPSTIGKEAWMVFFLGLAALGGSALIRHSLSPWHLAALIAGAAMAARIRPHMAALMVVSLVGAAAWPKRSTGKRGQQLILAVLGFGLLTVVMGQVATFFSADRVELSAVLDFAQARTAEGGSEFSSIPISGPQNIVQGTVSVLFRPFLFETSNAFQLLGSLESLGMMTLAVVSYQRLRRVPRLFLNNTYVRFAVLFSLGFIVAFSVISNFGILTRQRAQLWPILLVLFALSPAGNATYRPSSANNTNDTNDTNAAVVAEPTR